VQQIWKEQEMDIRQALQQRRSVRAFLPQAVAAATVRDLLETAAQARPAAICSPGV
jgi:nitroreductase